MLVVGNDGRQGAAQTSGSARPLIQSPPDESSIPGHVVLAPHHALREPVVPTGAARRSAGDRCLLRIAEWDVAVDLGLFGEAEHALADDVALNLVCAASDRGEVGVEGE